MIIDVNDTCAFGGVTLGQTDSFGVESYFTGLDGWGAPQSTAQPTQRAAGDGGFASPAFLQYRVFTVSGAFVADTRSGLVAAFDRLQAAATIAQQPVTVTNGGAVRYSVAQRTGEVTITDESDVYMAFSITFLAADPRKFGADITASTRLPTATGGWTFPFHFPLTIGSTVVSGTVSVTSPGSMIGKVVLRVDGPIGGPVITHIGSGSTLVFASSYALSVGSWLTIDMDAHTVLENDQADRAGFITSRGWFGLDPGVNTVAFSATVPNVAAQLTLTGTPAWP